MEFIEVCEDGTEQIVIFVHGFRPRKITKSQKTHIKEYKDYINWAGIRGEVFLCNWNSTGTRLPTLALTKSLDFIVAQKRAKKEGDKLLDNIKEKFGDTKGKKIFLIGHSLGTLLIHRSLVNHRWENFRKKLPLQDVVYLASAVPPVEDHDWEAALKSINGKLFSLYSPKDGVLGKTIQRRIGKSRLNHPDERIVDAHCKGYGHQDYLQNLKKVLRKWHFRTHSELALH